LAEISEMVQENDHQFNTCSLEVSLSFARWRHCFPKLI